jgi:hypothetical protein
LVTFLRFVGFCWIALTLTPKPTFWGLGGALSALVRLLSRCWFQGVFLKGSFGGFHDFGAHFRPPLGPGGAHFRWNRGPGPWMGSRVVPGCPKVSFWDRFGMPFGRVWAVICVLVRASGWTYSSGIP